MRRLLIALVILGAAFYAAGALDLGSSVPDPRSKDTAAASASIKRTAPLKEQGLRW